MKGFFIDGISTSGKSIILFHLMNKLNKEFPNMSKIFISEHYTQRILESKKDSGELQAIDIKNHLEKIIGTLEIYNDMFLKSKFFNTKGNADIIVILERFLFSFLVDDKISGYKEKDIISNLSRLNKVGIKNIFLRLSDKLFKQRLISSLNFRNPKWKLYLHQLGDIDGAVNYFVDQQNKYLLLIKKYCDKIDTIILEINNDDYKKFANIIFQKIFVL